MAREKELSPESAEKLPGALKVRFGKNMNGQRGFDWAVIQARVEVNPEKQWSLHEMERTRSEPDVVDRDDRTGEYLFCDCSTESPQDRRSLCYDREAPESRKTHKPEIKKQRR